jgi:mono/diheme cytochrome c family protein
MTRHPAFVAGAAAVAVVAAVGVGVVLKARWFPATVALAPDDAQLTALGESVYRAHCAACHGARLEGQPNWRERLPDGRMPAPPHDASGHTWHHADDVLFRITKFGVGAVAGQPGYPSVMPRYEGVLSDAQIVAVLSWIKSQWPPEVRARHDDIDRRWRESQR